MTMTTPNKISEEDEFGDPNVNYHILLTEMRERIVNLQYDINNIRDPEILGFAIKIYTDLKIKYFDLTAQGMDLEHDVAMERYLSDIADNIIRRQKNE